MIHWTNLCFIILIFSFIMTPIERRIYKKIPNKYWAYLVTAVVAAVILLSLQLLAGVIGL